MSARRDIAAMAVGHVTHDRYGDRIRAGGSAYYAAKTWLGLGAQARIVTAVGRDFACERELTGIAITKAVNARTTSFTNRYPHGSRPDKRPSSQGEVSRKPGGTSLPDEAKEVSRQMFVESVAPAVRPSLLGPDDRHPDILFLCPVIGEVDPHEWLDAVHGRIVGLGIQGWLKQPGPEDRSHPGLCRVVPRRWDPSPDLLCRVHAVFVSREDLDGHDRGLLAHLRRHVPLVFVTLGPEGSLVYARSGPARIGVHPAEAADPTGAGDTFAAAVLFALARGESPADAARLGAAAASIVVEGEAGASLGRVGSAFERARRVA